MCLDSSSPPSVATDGPEALLLEHAACDDVPALTAAAEEGRLAHDSAAPWYGRWWAHGDLRPVRYELRTPLMVAALYGSSGVVQHLLSVDPSAVNRPCGSDSATALHCAAVGGAASALHVVRLLLAAGADVDAVDAGGRRAVDVLARQRSRSGLETLLRGGFLPEVEEEEEVAAVRKERKEYPVDATLPDIKSGIYGTDEFRMYTFKVKPCSRAYSHDWTECPFVHPGENARRRDPRKYHYSCVPCPDFRKGACRAGDACEYAHGVFESWLHPAQYRTRLCKDETGCARRVCFFAHKPEELRPLYPSSPSSLVSSPRSSSVNLPPLDLNSAAAAAALLLNQQQPMSPSTSAALAWLNQNAGVVTTPTPQLPSSRLKSGITARDMDLELEMMGFDGYGQQLKQQQQLMEEIASISPPTSWANSPLASVTRAGAAASADYGDLFGPLDNSSLLSPMQSLSLKQNAASQYQSPPQLQKHQQQFLYGGTNLSSSPSARSSSSLATSLMNARASAFAKRSQSFIDRGPSAGRVSSHAIAPPVTMSPPPPAAFSDWGSPDGKLDWAIQGEELNKLRKSASFAFRGNRPVVGPAAANEPDVSWVQSLVKEGPPAEAKKYHLNSGAGEFRPSGDKFPAWGDQLCFEQEQMVA